VRFHAIWDAAPVPVEQGLSRFVHDLLARRVASPDAGQPLLVHRDETAGTRVELSGASLTNTVAKAAALFEEEPGGALALAIAPHWIGAALTLAAWHGGLTVRLDDPAGGYGDVRKADIGVVGPDVPDVLPGEWVLASRLHPFGLPFDPDVVLPGSVDDLALSLRSGPDRLGPAADHDHQDSSLQQDGATYGPGELIDAAHRFAGELEPGSTLLSTLPFHDLRGLLAVTLVPLLTGGSTVLVTGTMDGEQVARLAGVERASTTWDGRSASA
jgi:uncharacterized protein (TIGR03089 family)